MAGDLTIRAEIGPTTVARAAAGDVEALAGIVHAHHDDMARIARVICGDADLAQDAVQAAWPICWQKLASLRDARRLRPWLMSVAANEARQIMRRRRHRILTEIDAHDPIPGMADPSARSGLIDLSIALRRLPPDDRALLALRYVAELDATEIGRALGLSSSGVRSRLARLLARLRAELDHE